MRHEIDVEVERVLRDRIVVRRPHRLSLLDASVPVHVGIGVVVADRQRDGIVPARTILEP